MNLRNLLALALTAACATASAEQTTLRFHGYGYDLKTGRYLFTEVHEQVIEDGRWVRGTMTFVLPDGSLLGRKTIAFGADRYVPEVRLDLPKENYVEGVRGKPGDWELFRKEGTEPAETARYEDRPPLLASDSGIHPLIRDHFGELLAGKKLRFRLIVAGSLDVFRFKVWKIGDTRFEGKPAVRLQLEPDSLLSWLAAPIELIYEVDQRKLVDYRGISNVRDPATHKQYNVHIVYSSTPPADAPPLPPGY